MASIPANLFREHRQIIFRKRSNDFLGNPKVDRLLTESVVGEYVIAGIGLEAAVKSLALGLITRMKRVAVVYDACGFWNVSAADLSLRQMEAKGVRLEEHSIQEEGETNLSLANGPFHTVFGHAVGGLVFAA